jgi:alkylhydroperoxidase family enzyme
MIGVAEPELEAARQGASADPKTDALLKLATQIVRTRARISPADLAAARSAGVSDAEIVETVAAIALNVFTNYLNIVVETEIDFPILHTSQLATA